ncbi:MAG: hypothetical protein OEZ35_02665 [Candidatus Bathyarchaeota archaeon]|nr:hypothetical protein [Candidatus Bathyarchaeota archaeon]
MRADYGLYIVAIICFIIAGLVLLEAVPKYLPEPATFEATAMTVIFTALGLIFAILGYALRPKPIISITKAHKPALPPSPPSTLPPTDETATAPLSAPTTPTLPQEETAKPERKKPKTKTRRKGTGRRRKKET